MSVSSLHMMSKALPHSCGKHELHLTSLSLKNQLQRSPKGLATKWAY